LERNDIGRVAEFGTVEVDEFMVIERYSHVMHLVSNVKGVLRKDLDAFDLLKAMFPGGTITGAPKIRSMEIIEELEPTRRGFYTGSLGFVGYNGDMDFNIIIRSFIEKNNKVYFQVGAGIVYDSIPEREYKETINKARAMVLAYENLKSN
jgi:para-aminobenzoate synthetase component 1